jgi:putative transposase
MSDFTCHLSDSSWEKIWLYLNDYKGLHLKNQTEVRRFVEGIFWLLRSGSQWRMLPKEYGEWNHVYQRFCRWCDKGIWHKMLYYFAKDADMEYIMVDSTILRAHACAAGAKKRMEKVQKNHS